MDQNDPNESFDSTDQLWSLLGHARQLEPSPWLVSHVMRGIRECSPRPFFMRWGISAGQRWIVSGALAVLISAFIAYPSLNPSDSQESTLFAALDAFEENQIESEVLWLTASH